MRRETNADRKNFDVLGNRRSMNYASNTQGLDRETNKSDITPKIGGKTMSLCKYKSSMPEISPKIGFVEARENPVRKPQLKIGSNNHHNFIDTYTVN